MPFKTNKKTKPGKRRTFRKPKPSYNRLVTRGGGNINVGMFSDQPFPPRKHCKLVYCASHNILTNAIQSFGNEQQYTLNSLFKPDATGTGHQFMGFDQLMAIYAKYKVRSTRVELTWSNPDADGAFVGYKLSPVNDGANLAAMSFDRAQESRTVVCRPINNTGSQVVKQIFNVPGHVMSGLTRAQYNNEVLNYTGNAAANPPTTYGMRVAAVNPTSTTIVTIAVHIRLIADVDFYQRISLPQS